MLTWIIVIITIYLLIGLGIFLYALKTDQYAGIVLHFWWAIIFLYPILIIQKLLYRK